MPGSGPGPHLLNGALDVMQGRIHLGAARMVYAGLVLLAITTGLLLGLALLGQSLTIDPPGRSVPLWRDMIFAGVVAACYGIYFSMPMLAWPVAVGVLAHALRWVALTEFDASPAIAVLVASFFAGLVITPVARRRPCRSRPSASRAWCRCCPAPTSPGWRPASRTSPTARMQRWHRSAGRSLTARRPSSSFSMGVGLIAPKLLIDRFGEKPRWTGAKPTLPSLYG